MNNIAAPLAPDDLIHGRYRIVRPIGRGGMGAVYEAIDTRLGHQVALKQTLAVGGDFDQAFAREARVLAALRHPSLPVVSDYFSDDAGQFLVMQYIPGDDLATLLHQRGRPFTWGEVRPWAEQLVAALEYLHNQTPPIIHRDIKPQNVKLTPQGEVILLDFGLAKRDAGAATLPSIYGYTPQYASLEQIRAAGTDARSDLYSLAATLYALLSNTAPVNALDRGAAVLEGNPDPLRPLHQLAPNLPPHVGELLMRCLAIKAADRPASAAEVRSALANENRPSSAGQATIAMPRTADTPQLPPNIPPPPPPPPSAPSIPPQSSSRLSLVLGGAVLLTVVVLCSLSMLAYNIFVGSQPTSVVVAPSALAQPTLPPVPTAVEVDIPAIPNVGATVDAVQTEVGINIGGLLDEQSQAGDSDLAVLELEFGEAGTGPGLLNDPREIAVGPDGAIYVADYEDGRIQRFSPDGTFERSWIVPEARYVLSIAIDRTGRLYVSEAGRVVVIDTASGEIVETLEIGENGGFEDVTITGEGELFGLPWAQSDLLRVASDGNTIEQFDEPLAEADSTMQPTASTIDGLGNMYVIGDNGETVYIFGPEGNFRDRFSIDGGWAFSMIAVDGRGHIIVGGFMNGVLIYDESGRLLGTIDVPGVTSDLTIDDAGRLFVLTNEARVLRYSLTESR